MFSLGGLGVICYQSNNKGVCAICFQQRTMSGGIRDKRPL